MAWSALRESCALRLDGDVPPGTDTQLITRAVANALKPKLSVFFLAFLPQLVDGDRTGKPSGDGALTMLALGSLFVASTATTTMGYTPTAKLIRHYVVGQPAVMSWRRRAVAG